MNKPIQIPANTREWLMDPAEPGPRYLFMRDILNLPADDPVLLDARQEAYIRGPIANVLEAMNPDGYWEKPGPGYNPKYRSTVWSIPYLAQLGADVNMDSRITRACVYLVEHTFTSDGQVTYNGAPSGVLDCLQGNLCWAIRTLGFNHPRIWDAYEWMARMELGDGIAPSNDRSALVRYYSIKSGPNFQCGANLNMPCAWGAAKVMHAFSLLTPEERTPMIERAIQLGVEFFFSTDLMKANWPSGVNAKPSRNWWKFGFPVFYVTDLLQVAEALVSLGYGADPRMGELLTFIEAKQDKNGSWPLEYHYNGKTWADLGPGGKPSKWVTIRALRVLKAACN